MSGEMEGLVASLREAAKAATPGPWHVDHTAPGGGNVQSRKGPVADARWFGNSHREAMADYANAAHIALCSPDNITRLLDALERAEQALAAEGEKALEKAAPETIKAMVAHAMRVQLGGRVTWPDYMRDLWLIAHGRALKQEDRADG